MKRSVSLIFAGMLFVLSMILSVLVYPSVSYAAQGISVHIEGNDEVSIFGDLKIDKSTSGDVVAVFGNVDISSDVQGDVVVVFGNTNLNAEVSGEVVSIFGKVILTDKAAVSGDIVTIGTIEKAGGARLGGQEVTINTGVLGVVKALVIIALSILSLIFGLALISVSRNRFRSVSDVSDNGIGRKILFGFMGFVGIAILAVLLSITIIAPVIYLILLFVAQISAAVYFGKQIFKTFNISLNVHLEFVSGLLFIVLVKIALTLSVLQYDYIIYFVLDALFSMFVYSLGIGILLDSCLCSRAVHKKALNICPATGINLRYGNNSKADLKAGGNQNEEK